MSVLMPAIAHNVTIGGSRLKPGEDCGTVLTSVEQAGWSLQVSESASFLLKSLPALTRRAA